MGAQIHRLGLSSNGTPALSKVQSRLLNDWQRDLPLVPQPFGVIAEALGIDVTRVLQQLAAFCADGTVSRVGPVFRPNSIGASTLVAVAVPPDELEVVAALINQYDEVNHNYEREHEINLWFVATAADQDALRKALDGMEQRVARRLLRLPLIRDYHIDLGFQLSWCRPGTRVPEIPLDPPRNQSPVPMSLPATGDTACSPPLSSAAMETLLADIQSGLPLVERPYQAVAARVGCTEAQVIDALGELLGQGIIKRMGVVVRHHELGYRANAMVVWDVPDARVDALGQALGAESDVTLCYQRPRVAGCWPYNLFCMIHGQERDSVMALVQSLAERHGLHSIPHQVLFSGRRFKQRGARYRGLRTVAETSVCVASHG